MYKSVGDLPMNHPTTESQTDGYAWIYHQMDLLRQRRWMDIDVDILIEELDSMAKRDKHELVNYLIILIAHLLKWQFQLTQLTQRWQTFQGSSWRRSIKEQRKQVLRQLKMSPSLKSYLAEAVAEAYPDAVDLASDETGLPFSSFPAICLYTIAELLDDNFYPTGP